MRTRVALGGFLLACLAACATLTPLAARERAGLLAQEALPDEEFDDSTEWLDPDLSEPAEEDETWFDNLSFFGGLDGSKQPQDFGVNANLGGRFSVNIGLPLWREAGLGFQLGTGLVGSANAVQVFERVSPHRDRFQCFTTAGLFQRLDYGLQWACGYDHLAQDYYDYFHLGQWRGQAGCLITERNEFGAWGTVRAKAETGFFGAVPVRLRPLNMGSLYWRHTWSSFAQTTLWGGFSESHGQVNLALGDLPRSGTRFLYGADIHVPLSDSFAIFGQANLITPAGSGTVDAFLGLEFYPGRRAWLARERRFAPVLSVAGSPTFAVDMVR